MHLRTFALLSVLQVGLVVSGLDAQSVFVAPPNDGVTTSVARFTGNPFTPAGAVAGAPDTFLVVSTPAGNKFYLIGRSATDTVVATDANLGVLKRLNLGQGGTAARITPNGTRLLVAAGSLHVIDTATDTVVLSSPVGFNPTAIAVSNDSSRAFVLSPTAQSLTVIDPTNGGNLGSISIVGGATGVALAPNGLLYVTAQNAIQEIDPRTLAIRQTIAVNARPGPLSFTPDGALGVAVNQTPITGGSLVTLDMNSRTAQAVGAAGGALFEQVHVISNTRAIGLTNQALFNIGLFPVSFAQADFGVTGIRGFTVSDEVLAARFLFVTSGNTLTRVDLSNNQPSGQNSIPNITGPVSFAGAASTGPVSNALLFNNSQTLTPLAQSLPLVIRVIDASGRPVSNVPVTFAASTGAVLISSMGQTNAQGFAQATVQAPSLAGGFQVTANIGPAGGLTALFNLTVGTTGGGPVTAGIQILSGNGQIVRESSPTPEELRVIVRDAAGNPIPNAAITWTLTGTGALVQPQTTFTDAQGISFNRFIGGFFSGFASFDQSTINAATATGSVNFVVTTVPIVFPPGPGGTLVPFPTVEILTPGPDGEISGRAGESIPGAVRVRVTAAPVGVQAGSAIPNAGLRVVGAADPSLGPTGSCQTTTGGEVLTGPDGIATCDFNLSGRVGTQPLQIFVGGQQIQTNTTLRVTAGLPGQVRITQGDGQSGAPGATLPLALVAEVLDTFGNRLPGAQGQWSVVSGDVTLINSISTSDGNSRVSTQVRLGSTAGTAQIRYTAGTASATFTVTTIISATQLQKISGDPQTAIVGQAFGQQLIVLVLNAQNQPVQGVSVAFTVTSGAATVNPPAATTGADGRAATSVQAGATAGPVVITATAAGLSATFNLTVNPPGPTVAPSGFLNGAGFTTGISPCSIATIRGTAIAGGMQGIAVANTIIGPLPFTLAGVSVSFGGLQAPIFNVSNVGGQESVTVQVPCETPAPSNVAVTIQAGGGSATVPNVPIQPTAPGIFETGAAGARSAVVTRPDGSFVSAANPARRGETVRMYVTGLGLVNPGTATNQIGIGGQNVVAQVIVGVNNAGVQPVSVQYAPGMVGVYIVDFQIDPGTTPGPNRPLAVATVGAGGNLIFGNGSSIAIQ